MRLRSVLPWALALTAMPSVTAWGHGFHTSTVELTHRPDAKRLEGSLLVAPADLARALDGSVESLSREAIQAHLRAHFVVTDGRGPRPLTVVGEEMSRRGLWVHFVIEDLPTLEGAALEHRILAKTEPFALNTVELRGPQGRIWVETLDRSRTRLQLGHR